MLMKLIPGNIVVTKKYWHKKFLRIEEKNLDSILPIFYVQLFDNFILERNYKHKL